MLNSISLLGRLTRDPELKHTPQGVAVCTITLAVERDRTGPDGRREADFIDVVAWRGTAELVARWFRKGLLVAVTGRLQSRRWEDQYDQHRTSWEVVAESVYFAERAKRGQAAPEAAPAPSGAPRRGPRTDLKPVDPRNADVFPEEDSGDYSGDLYRGDLPHSDFEEFDEDGDVPF